MILPNIILAIYFLVKELNVQNQVPCTDYVYSNKYQSGQNEYVRCEAE